jgi:hypothetical protein
MDIGGIDILQMLQDLLDNLNSPEFRDAGFCEGLPEEEKETHPVHFGKEPFTGLFFHKEQVP